MVSIFEIWLWSYENSSPHCRIICQPRQPSASESSIPIGQPVQESNFLLQKKVRDWSVSLRAAHEHQSWFTYWNMYGSRPAVMLTSELSTRSMSLYLAGPLHSLYSYLSLTIMPQSLWPVEFAGSLFVPAWFSVLFPDFPSPRCRTKED